MKYDIKCCECGRFCKPVDSGTFYGSCNDTEPSEPDYFCRVCYDKRILIAKTTPEKIIIGCWWLKPDYVAVAKSVLRHRKKLTLTST